jgi:hypothetical protein
MSDREYAALDLFRILTNKLLRIRLMHHAHVINIRGETYRLKDRLKTGVQTVPAADIPALEKPAEE